MPVKAYLITLADHLCALLPIYFPHLSVEQKKRKRTEKKETKGERKEAKCRTLLDVFKFVQ